jgi:hypothetical protein
MIQSVRGDHYCHHKDDDYWLMQPHHVRIGVLSDLQEHQAKLKSGEMVYNEHYVTSIQMKVTATKG